MYKAMLPVYLCLLYTLYVCVEFTNQCITMVIVTVLCLYLMPDITVTACSVNFSTLI